MATVRQCLQHDRDAAGMSSEQYDCLLMTRSDHTSQRALVWGERFIRYYPWTEAYRRSRALEGERISCL